MAYQGWGLQVAVPYPLHYCIEFLLYDEKIKKAQFLVALVLLLNRPYMWSPWMAGCHHLVCLCTCRVFSMTMEQQDKTSLGLGRFGLMSRRPIKKQVSFWKRSMWRCNLIAGVPTQSRLTRRPGFQQEDRGDYQAIGDQEDEERRTRMINQWAQ